MSSIMVLPIRSSRTAEQAAGGVVHVDVAAAQIGEEERVGRLLDELAGARLGGAAALGHVVEGARELADLVGARGQVRRVRLATADPAGGDGERVDGPGDPAGDRQARGDQHDDHQRGRAEDEAEREAAVVARLGGAARQQLGLVGVELVDDGAHVVHQRLAGAGGDERRGGVEATAAARLDDLGHLGGAAFEQPAEPVHAFDLRRVVGDEGAQPRQIGASGLDGVVVGREQPLVAAEHVAARAGLRVERVLEHDVDRLLHLVRVLDPARGAEELAGADERQRHDQQHDRRGRREARADSGTKLQGPPRSGTVSQRRVQRGLR
jgi:hypothetical protein